MWPIGNRLASGLMCWAQYRRSGTRRRDRKTTRTSQFLSKSPYHVQRRNRRADAVETRAAGRLGWLDDYMVWSSASMTAGRHVGLAVAAVIAMLLTLAAAPAGVALAAAPELKIEQPAAGSFTKAHTPSFAGTTNDILDPVTLAVYE